MEVGHARDADTARDIAPVGTGIGGHTHDGTVIAE
jgi:hypothetical protein